MYLLLSLPPLSPSLAHQMVAFLEKYIELRGECQESFYNFGRAFHTIGLVQNAAHFYKRALECSIPVQGSDSVRFLLPLLNFINSISTPVKWIC